MDDAEVVRERVLHHADYYETVQPDIHLRLSDERPIIRPANRGDGDAGPEVHVLVHGVDVDRRSDGLTPCRFVHFHGETADALDSGDGVIVEVVPGDDIDLLYGAAATGRHPIEALAFHS